MNFPFDVSNTFGAPQAPTGTSRRVAEFFGGGDGPSFGGALLYRAWQRDPNSLQVSLFPCGPVLHIVKLLGIPEPPTREEIERDLQSSRVRFFLSDFSGRIECEFTVVNELTEYRRSLILDALFSGGLVAVFGSVNLLGKEEPSLRVHAVAKVNTAAEVLFHETECQASFLRLKFRGEDLRGSSEDNVQNLQQPQYEKLDMKPEVYGQHQPHDPQITRSVGHYGPFGA